MAEIWHTVRGYLAGVVSFIACPCHLPLTLPLLISLTAGTVFGTWLAQNSVLVRVVATAAFIGGLTLAFKWSAQLACPPTFYATPSLPTSKTRLMK